MKENIEMLFVKSIEALKLDEDFTRRTEETEKKLKETLNHDERVLLNDYTDTFFEFIRERSAQYFKQGFWIGCEMTRELQEI